MARRINHIQRDPKKSREWTEIHPRLLVDDHRFPTNRFAVNVNIAPQKMFGLRIECIAQSFIDENLATASGGNQPDQDT